MESRSLASESGVAGLGIGSPALVLAAMQRGRLGHRFPWSPRPCKCLLPDDLLSEYLREEPLLFNLLLSQGPFAFHLGLRGAAAASDADDFMQER